jgi:lipopolysaccharide/colanic/teichoic acid biosynthesis glycosyltransferase
MIYSNYAKVFFDKLMAIVLGILLFPLIVIICFLLFVTQGNPIIFVQTRSGMNLRKFRLYKFRTLTPIVSTDLSISKRKFTFFGNIMRRSGLDEIPQLINIMKGDMSFVGPRPLPIEYEKLYHEVQLGRFKVKPGITGWAQVKGRNDMSWVHRFELDVWYVNNITFLLDLKIICLTFIQIVISIFYQNKKQIEMQVFNGANLF